MIRELLCTCWDLSQMKWTFAEGSRALSTVKTAIGEVQINEDAQMHVHDLDLFVTMQILDETSVILFLRLAQQNADNHVSGKNGETPRLTPNMMGRQLLA